MVTLIAKMVIIILIISIVAIVLLANRVSVEQIREWSSEAITKPYVCWQLLAAVAIVESSLNPNAESEKGAKGLFQFMPNTVKDIAMRWSFSFDLFDPKASTKAAKLYLAWLMRKFPEDINLVLAAWNWGYGNVQKWVQNKKEMPKETQLFIRKVLLRWEKLMKEGSNNES